MLEAVSKQYRVSEGNTLLGALARRGRPPSRTAIDAVDLTVRAGESVGIMGHNGAGKTTMLRLLAGVTSPTAGRVRVVGRIAPLISVGVGFHQELSGRENVAVNGTLLGMGRREIRSSYDAIVEFSGLDESVLQTPVKFYSSGMLLRLAFSVAIHLDPDVLLVDELLAVGDASFQARCLARMRELRAAGTTVVLVSHSAHTIRGMCPRTLVMHRGRKVFDGRSEEAIAVHDDLLARGEDDAGPAVVALVGRSVTDSEGRPVEELSPWLRHHLRYQLRFAAVVESPQVHFTVTTERGDVAYQIFSTVGDRNRAYGPGDEVELDVAFTARMVGGTYHCTMQVLDVQGRRVLGHDAEGVLVRVGGRPGISGIADLDATVAVDGKGCHTAPRT